MNYLKISLTLITVFLLAIPSFAQDDEGSWRTFEVSIGAGYSSPSGDIAERYDDTLGAQGGFSANVSGGYYLTEAFCAGIYFNYSQWGAEGDYDVNYRNYDFGLYTKYAFVNDSYFEPYLKVTGGMIWPKYPTWETADRNVLREQSYDPGFGFSGNIGVLYYTSDYGALYLQIGYHQDFLDKVEAQNYNETYMIESNSQYFEISAGVNVFFGPE